MSTTFGPQCWSAMKDAKFFYSFTAHELPEAKFLLALELHSQEAGGTNHYENTHRYKVTSISSFDLYSSCNHVACHAFGRVKVP